MRRILIALAALLPAIALAGFPFEATLEEMAASVENTKTCTSGEWRRSRRTRGDRVRAPA